MILIGIGLGAVTQDEVTKLVDSGEHMKVEQYLEEKNVQPIKKPCKPKHQQRKPLECDMLIYDLETSGFRKDAEITQLACVDIKGEREFSTYIMPKRAIDPSASKVTGLSVGYSQGVRVLCKDGKPVEADDLQTALKGFSDFLNQPSNKPVLLVAHNGQSFDAPRIVFHIEAEDLIESFPSDILFGDSLIASRKFFKRKNHLKLSDIYYETFKQQFSAHDALQDCKALQAILSKYGNTLQEQVCQTETPLQYYRATRQYHSLLTSVKDSYAGHLTTSRVVNRLANIGVSFTLLRDLYQSCGKAALISFLAGKSRGHVRVTEDIGELCKILKRVS
ncbi:MAG: hypothetical protein DSY43_01905 [Gammaproteobacteria bacterium]|nr:MAG: hypothetical protein DSY43_01905 [Gammaproteobacteria bacterium]